MPQSVLVTGAFGKVGSAVLRHLLAAGHRVVAVDLQTPNTAAAAAAFGEALTVIWGNICDPNLWPNALMGIDTVVHLAAIIPPASDRNPKLTTAVNVTATAELVKHMEASPTAKRLVFASSMVVAGYEQYRRTPPLRADEPPQPVDLYSQTKADAEAAIRASSLRWSILRLTLVTSPEISFKEAQSIDAMFDGSVDGRVEVVHTDDAALAFANAASCEDAVGKILFIGGGESCRTRVLEFYNRTLGTLGLGPLDPDVLRPGPAYYFGDWVDTAESQRLLKFQRHSLNDLYASMKASVGYRRLLLKLASPLINSLIERRSPYRARG